MISSSNYSLFYHEIPKSKLLFLLLRSALLPSTLTSLALHYEFQRLTRGLFEMGHMGYLVEAFDNSFSNQNNFLAYQTVPHTMPSICPRYAKLKVTARAGNNNLCMPRWGRFYGIIKTHGAIVLPLLRRSLALVDFRVIPTLNPMSKCPHKYYILPQSLEQSSYGNAKRKSQENVISI